MDEATRGVATEQGALRAFQHFNLCHIAEFEQCGRRRADINIVHVERHGAFETRRGDLAANASNMRGLESDITRADIARHKICEILKAFHPSVVEPFARHSGNGNGDVLEVFRTLIGCHHNILKARRFIGSSSGPCTALRQGRSHCKKLNGCN